MALYLKYRPQSLNELIGQEQVKKTLLSSFESGKLSHAYLFVGPRGTGKTSTARILAKMVNCEVGGPCNKCKVCLSITDGSNLDLIEIDAASNRGIDDIRQLRERINLAPTASKKKVYIIDEVHMLTTEAFNALLKTLEEPPAHALFILATTEAQKVPQTILSRVQRLDFKLAKPAELEQALTKIIKEEKIDIETEALKLLIKRAEGSFRDGVKLLDQVGSDTGKITLEKIQDSLKSTKFEEILALLEFLSAKKITQGLMLINKQIEEGVDIKDFMLSLMDTFRSLVFVKNDLGEKLVRVHLSEEQYGMLLTLADKFGNHDLLVNLEVLQKAIEKLKFTSIPSLPLELAIVEICEGQAIEKNQNSSVAIIQEQNTLSAVNKTIQTVDDGKSKVEQQVNIVIPTTSEASSPTQPLVSDNETLKIKEKWTFVLETVRQYNFSLEALLKVVNIKDCIDNTVLIEVPYAFHQRILEAPKNRELLESLLSDILGRLTKVETVVGERPPKKDDIVNIEVAADDDIIRAAAEIFSSDTVN